MPEADRRVARLRACCSRSARSRTPWPGCKQFVARNLAGGVDHMFLFVDDFDAAGHRRAEPAPARDRDRRPGRELVASASDHGSSTRGSGSTPTWSRRCSRRSRWADDWLFHIDGDEALQVDRAGARRPPARRVGNVRARPARGGQPQEVAGRTRSPTSSGCSRPDELTLLHVLGVIDEPLNGHYFHGHCEGKSGLRPRDGPVDHACTTCTTSTQEQVPSTITARATSRGCCTTSRGRVRSSSASGSTSSDSGTKVELPAGTRAHGGGAAGAGRARTCPRGSCATT